MPSNRRQRPGRDRSSRRMASEYRSRPFWNRKAASIVVANASTLAAARAGALMGLIRLIAAPIRRLAGSRLVQLVSDHLVRLRTFSKSLLTDSVMIVYVYVACLLIFTVLRFVVGRVIDFL